MRYIVSIYTTINLIIFINECNSLGISSKLDLDGFQSSAPLVKETNKYRFVPRRQSNNEEKKQVAKVEEVGVICVSGEGCNNTKTNQSSDSIETDVVVHVKTKVDVNDGSKKNTVVEETPEVPIIIGTDDKKFNDNQNVIVNSGVFLPTTTSAPFFIPSRNLQTGSLFTPSYDFPSAEPRIDVKLEEIPTISIGKENFAPSVTGDVELHVPRFEPSFHNHYFQENPPPQVVWYPKATNSGYKPTAKPLSWTPEFVSSTVHRHYGRPGVTCSCKNEVGRGLQWRPKRPTYGTNAGSQINDKLSPLV